MKNLSRVTTLMMVAGLITAGLATGPVFGSESATKDEADASQKAVLVTGASTGIGRKITELLAARGVFVYAGARKEKDLKELDAIDNVQSIRLDVTIQELVELNQDHAFSYDRDALIEMLDEALAAIAVGEGN